MPDNKPGEVTQGLTRPRETGRGMEAPEPSAYVMSMATNWPRLHIETWQFPDMAAARAEMLRQLKARVEIEGPEDADQVMSMLESGMEYSNVALSENKAHIYEDCASIWRCWQVTPVMPYPENKRAGT